MSDGVLYLIVLASLLIVVVLFAGRATLRARVAVTEQYRKLADTLGLELQEPETHFLGLIGQYPSVYGERAGREMSVGCYGYGLGNSRQTDTAVTMSVKHRDALKFVLSKRTLSGRLGQLGRNQTIPIEDERFNSRFLLRGSDLDTVRALMDSRIRELVMSQWPSDTGFLTLGGDKLTYVEFGLMLDDARREHIQQAIQFMDALIERIARA